MKVFLKNTILFSVIFALVYCSTILVIIHFNRKIVENCKLNENTNLYIIICSYVYGRVRAKHKTTFGTSCMVPHRSGIGEVKRQDPESSSVSVVFQRP